MQAVGGTKRKSDQLDMHSDGRYTVDMMSQKIPTKGGSSHPQESPSKRQRVGITLVQKQALLDNLQLEITERARKLRSNYNIHAQSLRTRIEIRVNRIPLSLRKLTMGELLERYSNESQEKPRAMTSSVRGPAVPAKDVPSRPPTRGTATAAQPSTRPAKRQSHEIAGGDKENENQTSQKKMRANTATDIARNPAHVLSPTTSNSRVAPRTIGSPARSGITRSAVTPGRAALASNILNRMVHGARSTTRPATATGAASAARKAITSTATSSSSSSSSSTISTTTGTRTTTAAATAAGRKRGATVTAAVNHPNHLPSSISRPATRMTRRASGISESSENSTSTVIRHKRPMTAPPGAQPKPPPAAGATAGVKRAVMSTIKKGVAAGTARKAPAAKATAVVGANGTGTGRVLRKRA
ncbi:hypothetical protein N657DRAFT_566491 [Parathielavia appendiculata]|uniref:Borealin N-terminal domain-containing protein n=1 Tax=Parathielavia appendiculata TaxID=2587402 RepID=A0AAN6U6L6_9PEZI|nr:hypothetical protein N657DRAFT_566491 [Parathielavia appendiculata]